MKEPGQDVQDQDVLQGRLEWLRNPDRCACPLISAAGTPDGALEEILYILRELATTARGPAWAKGQAEMLRKRLRETASMRALDSNINQIRDELSVLQADIDEWNVRMQAKKMDEETLQTRICKIDTSLEEAEERGAQVRAQECPERLTTIALRKAQLRTDQRCIATQIAASEPQDRRLHEERLRRKQGQSETYERIVAPLHVLRHESDALSWILQKRASMPHMLRTECKSYEEMENLRREKDGHVARSRRCPACEFPGCEACGRRRTEAEGPVLVRHKEKKADGRKEEGPWYSDAACPRPRRRLVPRARPCRPRP
jgi:hypothetical protein